MRILQLAFATALALAAPRLAAQSASPMIDTAAYTAVATALRTQPQPAAAVLSNLPAGWPVRVSSCATGWCSVRTGSLAGFLPEDAVTLSVPRVAATASASGTSIGVDLTSRLTVGFAAGRSVRLVPEVSYVSQGSKQYGNNTQIGTYIVNGSDKELWFGVGIYYITPLPVQPLGAPWRLYLGPRAGVAIVNTEAKVENTTIPTDATAERTDVWAGVVVGSELLVSPHFSVGAEGQVTKVFVGASTVSGVTTNSVGLVQSWVDVETQGTLVLRFYP